MAELRVHHYVPKVAAVEWPSDPPCGECDLVRGHRVHDVDPVPEEAREIDARVLGELEREGEGA